MYFHILSHIRSFVITYGDMITLMVLSSCLAVLLIEVFRRYSRRSH